MREVGMMFRPEMILGLGRAARKEPFGKFEDRRLVKPQPTRVVNDWSRDAEEGEAVMYQGKPCKLTASRGRNKRDAGELTPVDIKPKAQPGDWIYAKETHAPCMHGRIAYRADEPDFTSETRIKWHSAMLMPKRYSRYRMRCTEVRAERLLEITEHGAQREGVFADHFWKFSKESKISCSSPRDAYLALFDSINGDGAAAKNPWVWVYKWQEVECRG